jgi:hypothetical protein
MGLADDITTGTSPNAARRDKLVKLGNPVTMKEHMVDIDTD